MANYTLNYTGEKVDELLNKIDTAFGEITVMSDTLTWDGNTEGYKVEVDNGDGTYFYYYHVSDATPTLDDFVNGMSYTMVVDGAGETTESVEYSADSFMDVGGGALMIPFGAVIPTDNHSDSGITFEKKGCYFMVTDSAKVISATINGYTGFETTEVKTIDPKYLPSSGGGVMKVNVTHEGLDDAMCFINPTADKTYAEVLAHVENGGFAFAVITVEAPTYAPLIMINTELGNALTFQLYMGGTMVTVSLGSDDELLASIISE